MLTYADVCWSSSAIWESRRGARTHRLLARSLPPASSPGPHIRSRMLTYAHVCSRIAGGFSAGPRSTEGRARSSCPAGQTRSDQRCAAGEKDVHTSAYVSICQHTYRDLKRHTSAYVSIPGAVVGRQLQEACARWRRVRE